MYVCIYLYLYMYIYIYIYIYICFFFFICLYNSMYIYIYIYEFSEILDHYYTGLEIVTLTAGESRARSDEGFMVNSRSLSVETE